MAAADGAWNIVVDSPLGRQELTLKLTTEGGTLSGEADTPFGLQRFEGGEVDGDDLRWQVRIAKPMPMTISFSAHVAGDEISGVAKLGAFGDAPFSGRRA